MASESGTSPSSILLPPETYSVTVVLAMECC
jgi:hypothetical protein